MADPSLQEWLASLGLPTLVGAFNAEGFNTVADVLNHVDSLDADDLEELGVPADDCADTLQQMKQEGLYKLQQEPVVPGQPTQG